MNNLQGRTSQSIQIISIRFIDENLLRMTSYLKCAVFRYGDKSAGKMWAEFSTVDLSSVSIQRAHQSLLLKIINEKRSYLLFLADFLNKDVIIISNWKIYIKFLFCKIKMENDFLLDY